jgi:hypothetical protein
MLASIPFFWYVFSSLHYKWYVKKTTQRSGIGKLYSVRNEKGQFVDIQTYERAQRADLRKKHTKNDKKK